MGFSKFAKQLAGDTESTQDSQQEGSSQAADQKGLAEVGADIKKAFANYQTSQEQGKDPNYEEIGDVAKTAFSAYNRGAGAEDGIGEENKNKKEEDVGKRIVSGLSDEVDEGLKTDEKVKGGETEEGRLASEGQGLHEGIEKGLNENEDEDVLPGEGKRTTRSGVSEGDETFAEAGDKSRKTGVGPFEGVDCYGSEFDPLYKENRRRKYENKPGVDQERLARLLGTTTAPGTEVEDSTKSLGRSSDRENTSNHEG